MERCALGLCEEAVRRDLICFVHHRFRRYVAGYAHRTNVPEAASLSPSPETAWHEFETWTQVRKTRAGRSYKQWLAARAAACAERLRPAAIESGVTLLVRDAVRERLRREYSRSGTMSLDTPIGAGSEAGRVTLGDLLIGTEDAFLEVDRRERLAAAKADAEAIFRTYGRRERVAILARESGLALSSATVCQVAGCGKSVLADHYRRALQRIAFTVAARHEGESPSDLAGRAVLAFEAVKQRVVRWGRSEKACAVFFRTSEGSRARAGKAACQGRRSWECG